MLRPTMFTFRAKGDEAHGVRMCARKAVACIHDLPRTLGGSLALEIARGNLAVFTIRRAQSRA
jgi:hypothetical protein